MIYLILRTHPPAIAACEDAAHAARYRERGFIEVDHAAFSAAWAERDRCVRLAQDIPPPGWVAAQDEPAPAIEHARWVVVHLRTETGA